MQLFKNLINKQNNQSEMIDFLMFIYKNTQYYEESRKCALKYDFNDNSYSSFISSSLKK